VKSDVLHMIDTAFADAGFGMPFPQRDVHLDTAQPLRIEVVGEK
jgi:small-conductance mechanosensitive channel